MSNPNLNHIYNGGGPTNHQNFMNMGNPAQIHQNPNHMTYQNLNGHMNGHIMNPQAQGFNPMNNYQNNIGPAMNIGHGMNMGHPGQHQMQGNPNNLHNRHGSGGQMAMTTNQPMQHQVVTNQPMLHRQTGTLQN